MEFMLNVKFSELKIKVDMQDFIEGVKILKGSSAVAVPEEVKTMESVSVVNELKDTSELNDVQTATNDTYQNYEQFKHMKNKLMELTGIAESSANDLIKKYGADMDHIPPNVWGKVIAEASDLITAAKNVKKEPEPKAESYTLEKVRDLARTVQKKHGREALEVTFKELGHTKLSEFMTTEYEALYMKLKEAE